MVTQAASDDFNEDECLCQGKVPKNKRIDVEQRVQDKDGKWKWKAMLRYHADCSVHGSRVKVAECHAD